MNDVKCEEHEGLMLLFMTLSFLLLLAAAACVLQGDSRRMHATIVLTFLFSGAANTFGNILPHSIPLPVLEAQRHRGVSFLFDSDSLEVVDALWRFEHLFSLHDALVILGQVEITFRTVVFDKADNYHDRVLGSSYC